MSASRKTPEQWAYTKMLHGRPVHTLHLMSMMKRHHQEEKQKLIRQMCSLTNRVAVSSRIMTKRQRLKYGANRFQDGKSTYYLFDRSMCPADIGVLIDLKGGELVYV